MNVLSNVFLGNISLILFQCSKLCSSKIVTGYIFIYKKDLKQELNWCSKHPCTHTRFSQCLLSWLRNRMSTMVFFNKNWKLASVNFQNSSISLFVFFFLTKWRLYRITCYIVKIIFVLRLSLSFIALSLSLSLMYKYTYYFCANSQPSNICQS